MNKKKIWIAVGIVVVVFGIGSFAVIQANNNGGGVKAPTTTGVAATDIIGGAKVEKGDLKSNVYISGTSRGQ